MKRTRYYLLIVIMLLQASVLLSQQSQLDSVARLIPVKYSVPDLPAFNALGAEPLNLLRPSTAKDLSVTADKFFDGKNIIIPKSFAVEFSPISLVKSNKLTLVDYQKSQAWYNLRISLGSLRDSMNTSRIALGFRTTLIDKGDPKNDENLKKTFARLNRKRDIRISYVKKRMSSYTGYISDSTYETLSNRFNVDFTRLASKPDSLKILNEEYMLESMKPQIDWYADNKQWNAERLDVAVAMVFASSDSLMKNMRFDALRAWLTYAVPVTDYGQFVTAVNVGCNAVNRQMNWSVSIPARMYYGTNDIKGLAEAQLYFNQIPSENYLRFNLGCEYRLRDSIWLNFTVGFKNDLLLNTTALVSEFKIMYGI